MSWKIMQDHRFSIVWLIVRVWLGYQWLLSGMGKLTNPQGVWIGDQAGVAIKGYWMKAAGLATAPDGTVLAAAAKYSWYQDFLKGLINTGSEVWFSYLIVVVEILVGIALILGLFTTLAALGGALMNLNFMLAGTASTNPVLYTLAIALILAGTNVGFYGIDRLIKQEYRLQRKGRPSAQIL